MIVQVPIIIGTPGHPSRLLSFWTEKLEIRSARATSRASVLLIWSPRSPQPGRGPGVTVLMALIYGQLGRPDGVPVRSPETARKFLNTIVSTRIARFDLVIEIRQIRGWDPPGHPDFGLLAVPVYLVWGAVHLKCE